MESMIDVQSQHNMLHDMIKGVPDLQRHDAIYSPYSDCGIFGHYFFGDPKYT